MHAGGALLVGRAPADHGLAADQGGTAGFLARGFDGGLDLVGVVAVHVTHHLPAIGFEAGRRVVGEPALGFAVDRNAVVVIEDDQLAQPERAGQRTGLVRDAFHKTAVAREAPGVMIHERGIGVIEARCQRGFTQRHAHGIGQTLAQRAGGRLDARGHEVFRMTRGLGMQLTKILDVVERYVIAGQMQ